MQRIEFKRALIAAIPLVLIIFSALLFDNTVNTYIRCEGLKCTSITNYLNNIFEQQAPITPAAPVQDNIEEKKKSQLEKDKLLSARFGSRITWSFLKSIYFIISLTVFLVACVVTYKSLADSGKSAIIWATIAIALSAGLGIVLWHEPQYFMSVWDPLFENTIRNDVTNIRDVMVRLNSFGFAAVIFAALASCTILYSPNENTSPAGLKQLSVKMKNLQLILYVGTIMLIVGVLLMRSMYHWSLTFISRDAALTEAVKGFFTNLLSAEGGYFTLVLAAIYLPTAMILRRRAGSLIGLPESNTEQETLLKEYGLTFSLTDSLPRVVAILGPLVAGSIGELFSSMK